VGQAAWRDGDLYFTSGPGTRKSRNLKTNPACTISVKLPGMDVTMEGTAARVTGQPAMRAGIRSIS
jgi:nitroimidazol reductase NimA-like FMN-containing flavoprotein (pyridoxamine 5'-phosphate oxidase superfamily)